MQSSIKWVVLLVAVSCGAQQPSNVPPMGWNTYFMSPSGNITPTEAQVETQALAMKNILGNAGYNLVVLDDGWSQRTAGLQVGVPARFPSGIPAVVSYVHGLGLKMGIYSSPGPTQCGSSSPGSYTFETTDATTFANWGMDYLKYDWCSGADVYPNTTPGMQGAYQTMANAIAGRSKPTMYYLVSAPQLTYGYGAAYTWFPIVGGSEYWVNEVAQEPSLDAAEFTPPWSTYQAYQSKGHWMENDFLVAGHSTVVTNAGSQNITDTQGQTQFNFFAMIAAPLITSVDLTTLNQTVISYLTNPEVIAVDQDSLGLMGSQFSNAVCGSTNCPVWTRTLANGNIAVAFFNRDTSSHTISLTYNALGGATSYYTRDILNHSNLGLLSSYSPTVAGTGSVMVILSSSPIGGSESVGYVKGLIQ